MTRRRPMTRAQSRQMRSLMEDGGWSRRDARGLVLAGFGEPQPDETLEDVKQRVTARALDRLAGTFTVVDAGEPMGVPDASMREWETRTAEFHESMQTQLKKLEEA